MNIHMKLLRDFDPDVSDSLRRDGWDVVPGHTKGEFQVSHPQITTEARARRRLYCLGFLTTGGIRIEFPLGVHERKDDQAYCLAGSLSPNSP